jgi:hypothetical protein
MRSKPAVGKQLIEEPSELFAEAGEGFVRPLRFRPLAREVTEQLIVEAHLDVLRSTRKAVGNRIE